MDSTQITCRTRLYVNDEAVDFFSMDMVASVHKVLFTHLSKHRLITTGVTTATQLEKSILPGWYLRNNYKNL